MRWTSFSTKRIRCIARPWPRTASWSDQRPNEVVFQFMMQRAQQAVDRTTRQVHEQGLGAHTRTLSARWDEAQLLLLIACLVAAAMAWLVGVRNKLLCKPTCEASNWMWPGRTLNV
jgi:hypothetical protein